MLLSDINFVIFSRTNQSYKVNIYRLIGLLRDSFFSKLLNIEYKSNYDYIHDTVYENILKIYDFYELGNLLSYHENTIINILIIDLLFIKYNFSIDYMYVEASISLFYFYLEIIKVAYIKDLINVSRHIEEFISTIETPMFIHYDTKLIEDILYSGYDISTLEEIISNNHMNIDIASSRNGLKINLYKDNDYLDLLKIIEKK